MHTNILTIMYRTQTILISILIFVASSKICEEPGECVDSIFLGHLPAKDSVDCMKKCQMYNNCNFGTFTSDYNCLLFQTCTRLETMLCPSCLTSSTGCTQCDISGLCLVSPYLILAKN